MQQIVGLISAADHFFCFDLIVRLLAHHRETRETAAPTLTVISGGIVMSAGGEAVQKAFIFLPCNLMLNVCPVQDLILS